ncbi:MAG: DUF3427 domain-containing protein [Oscillospiraceae bacterium]|nr:DUF3427 domain-containing protein [Oscillospiraceae bacterium]
MLIPGLYEQVISKALSDEISNDRENITSTSKIDTAEAPLILSKYISQVVMRGLRQVSCDDISDQLALANRIVAAVCEATGDDEFDSMNVDERAEQLMAVINRRNNIAAVTGRLNVIRPETSLSSSSLFTGAVHEPSMMTELKKEIISADRIDMLVSFIKWSGLRLIMDELKDFTDRGGKLRVISTTYLGATNLKAIEELRALTGAQIKISYDTDRTRLHAKSYVFYRNTGFTTAYIGSSNLSDAALSSGLEWNLKITAQDLPDTIKKINATFESYWESSDFSVYTTADKDRLAAALSSQKNTGGVNCGYNFDIRPFSYQQEILDRLMAEREVRGHYKNLIVAATGTGKTVISAFDYRRFRRMNPGKPNRLLFVAHREEILRQSLKCFRGILRDADFGELFVGSSAPKSPDNLFISVQTLNSRALCEHTDEDFYDFIIVDEFHHAAAPTYKQLLSYYKPKILLGLTATPERMDSKDVLGYFDDRIAAEIRLPEAIDRKLLCPFQYFGVADEVDLSDVKWSRGGYDISQLSDIYTGNDIRCMLIIKQLYKYVTDINYVTGLGFCVSKEHAAYMAKRFNESGIPSCCLTSDNTRDERHSAKSRLVSGEVKFIFTVDLYNEGVDIPEINTVLFLRPTESLTVFLQQLGRGLRLSEGKECLTVLDFIGQANKKYSFEQKFAALMSDTRRSVQSEIKIGFPSLPKGCYIKLEKVAEEYILENIRNSIGCKNAIVNRLASFEEDSGLPLNLKNFVSYYHIDLSVIYATKKSFARLCVIAGVRKDFTEPLEDTVTRAFARMISIDSQRWINFILENLPDVSNRKCEDYSECEIRMWQMLQFTVWQKSYTDCRFSDLLDGFRQLAGSPVMMDEVLSVLRFNYNRIDFVTQSVDLGFDCPLDLHCTYTRDQILAAFDFYKPSTVREGVKYLPDKKTDILFVTLNKSDKDYSPTTMYNDYSISDTLFHWQSQSGISPESATGQRYINHRKTGDRELIFVREYKNNRLGAQAYTFLGKAEFVSSTGSKPMNVVWRLEKGIPAKYLRRTGKMGVG